MNSEAGGGIGDHFLKGEKVEVCFDEDGFRGSWFPATVIRTTRLTTIQKNVAARTSSSSSDTGSGSSTSRSDNRYRKIYLKFNTLQSESDDKKVHTQYVDFLLVRPVPPREDNRSFTVNEEVDAFHNDGWWEGFIIDVIPPASPDKPASYSVYFRGSRELLVFPQDQIRLHREWVYGQWKPPLEVQVVEQFPPPPPPPPQHAASSSGSSSANKS